MYLAGFRECLRQVPYKSFPFRENPYLEWQTQNTVEEIQTTKHNWRAIFNEMHVKTSKLEIDKGFKIFTSKDFFWFDFSKAYFRFSRQNLAHGVNAKLVS